MEKMKTLAEYLLKLGIKSYYVGGMVRDEIMGLPSDDCDICLVGVTNEVEVEKLLLSYFDSVTPLVGQKFPVWIAQIDGQSVDIAIARKETLTGATRKDFDVVTKNVTIIDDLHRRDFTINSIAKDILTDEYIDPFSGILHIKKKKLHPTSVAFGEDTLRVYRAARFLARFSDFWGSPELYELCSNCVPNDISAERVGMELNKMLRSSDKPSKFFQFLKQIDWLKYHFVELHNLIGVPQNPDYHPEGDVFEHTMYCLDEAKDWFIRISMICHDLGKYNTTTVGEKLWFELHPKERGYVLSLPNIAIKSIGHEQAGKELTRNMLTRIHFSDHKTIRQIETLVELHMIRTGVSEKVVRKTLRRLTEKHLTYDHLVEVCRCDVSGRPPLAKYTPDIGQHRAKELLESNAMEPIVTGELLLANGYKPGKLIGQLVKKGLEWQDRGTLNQDNWMKMIKQFKPINYE